MSRFFIAILALCAVTGATAEVDLWDDIADEDFTDFTNTNGRALTGSGSGSGGSTTPAPTPAPTTPDTKITIANTMTGFTKATFVGKYQTAFIAASATELGVDASKVTLTNFADKARRLGAGRRLAASVTFDTVITLTAVELAATPALLATVETAAKKVAANPTLLATAFVAQQAVQNLVSKPATITSKPPTTSGGATPAPKKDGSSSKAWVAAPVVVILGAVGYMKYAGKGCFAPPTTKDGNIAGAATEVEGSAVAHQNAL
jgi:hypothetical protein